MCVFSGFYFRPVKRKTCKRVTEESGPQVTCGGSTLPGRTRDSPVNGLKDELATKGKKTQLSVYG